MQLLAPRADKTNQYTVESMPSAKMTIPTPLEGQIGLKQPESRLIEKGWESTCVAESRPNNTLLNRVTRCAVPTWTRRGVLVEAGSKAYSSRAASGGRRRPKGRAGLQPRMTFRTSFGQRASSPCQAYSGLSGRRDGNFRTRHAFDSMLVRSLTSEGPV